MERTDTRFEAAQKAINSIGLGFDITQDIDFGNCKKGPRLILINEKQCRYLDISDGLSVPDVPESIKCVRGESNRVHSEVLTLQEACSTSSSSFVACLLQFNKLN
ncbi:hypothetical protein PIB30_009396 [Stylosanthes scabra]|uniref:Uncharacterized protein n=1 Tax=Stylosanthes scabra TaxID=79078 RepID=A0ABU6V3J0_9FABA|nr:hypothetical protein [Stylosanthes scabra]